MRYMESVMAKVLESQGVNDPGKVAGLMMDALTKEGMVDPRCEARAKRNANIDRLKAEGLPMVVIAERVGLTRETCHRVVKGQLEARKSIM